MALTPDQLNTQISKLAAHTTQGLLLINARLTETEQRLDRHRADIDELARIGKRLSDLGAELAGRLETFATQVT